MSLVGGQPFVLDLGGVSTAFRSSPLRRPEPPPSTNETNAARAAPAALLPPKRVYTPGGPQIVLDVSSPADSPAASHPAAIQPAAAAAQEQQQALSGVVGRSRRANAGNRISELVKAESQSLQALERAAQQEAEEQQRQQEQQQARQAAQRQKPRSQAAAPTLEDHPFFYTAPQALLDMPSLPIAPLPPQMPMPHTYQQQQQEQELLTAVAMSAMEHLQQETWDWLCSDGDHSASEESDGEGGRRQATDYMPGCFKCQFCKAGCAKCITKPLVNRPFVRCKPEEGRHQQVPEAPTYYPSEAEFQDPFAYIESIKEHASKFGICRIVPPAGWNPPFSLEHGTNGRAADSFRFQTRKQFTSHLCMRAPRSFSSDTAGGAAAQGTGSPQQNGCVGGRMGRMDRQEAAPSQQQPQPVPDQPQQPQQPADSGQVAVAGHPSTGTGALDARLAGDESRLAQQRLDAHMGHMTHDVHPEGTMQQGSDDVMGLAGGWPPLAQHLTSHATPASTRLPGMWSSPLVSVPEVTPASVSSPLPAVTTHQISSPLSIPGASPRALRRVAIPQVSVPTSVTLPHSSVAPGLAPLAATAAVAQRMQPAPVPLLDPLIPEPVAVQPALVGISQAALPQQPSLQAVHSAVQQGLAGGVQGPGIPAVAATTIQRQRRRAGGKGANGVHMNDVGGSDGGSSHSECGRSAGSGSMCWGGGGVAGAGTGTGTAGEVDFPAPATAPAAQGSEQSEGTAEAKAGSDIGTCDGDEVGAFGHGYVDCKHTLQSFAAYSEWAKALHFRLKSRGDAGGKGLNGAGAAHGHGKGAKTGKGGKGKSFPGGKGKSRPGSGKGVNSGAEVEPEPSVAQVEAEFWRLVETPMPGRVVETLYGSDLDSSRHGSGFPLPTWRGPPVDAGSAKAIRLDAHAKEYQGHPWNINNMPRAAASLLRYAKCDSLVAGVMVPWLYVGSCMSAFCWHVEDHSLYSINYLHTGAPKVWYGVPSHASLSFEVAMRDALPHLFAEDPMLLHRLVTMLSPMELMARGVPVNRLVHEEGSFVVTFPGAYHSGLNTGHNVAESVNFAPPDWLPFGTDVVRRYRQQGKAPTLSHDMLLLTLVGAAQQVAHRRGLILPRPMPAISLDLGGVRTTGTSSSANGPQETENGSVAVVKEESGAECGQRIRRKAAVAAEAVIAAAVTGEDGLSNGGKGLVKPELTTAGALPGWVDVGQQGVVQQQQQQPPGVVAGQQEAGSVQQPEWMDRWRDGVTLGDAPPQGVAIAIGELAVRVDDERLRRAAAHKLGVTKEQRMVASDSMHLDARGVHTSTASCDCITCKCDLYLSAVISQDVPGMAACPEHVTALGVAPERCTLLYRYTIPELEARVSAALSVFRGAQSYVDAARQRVAAQPVAHVHRLGPIVVLEGVDSKFLPQGDEELFGGITIIDPFEGQLDPHLDPSLAFPEGALPAGMPPHFYPPAGEIPPTHTSTYTGAPSSASGPPFSAATQLSLPFPPPYPEASATPLSRSSSLGDLATLPALPLPPASGKRGRGKGKAFAEMWDEGPEQVLAPPPPPLPTPPAMDAAELAPPPPSFQMPMLPWDPSLGLANPQALAASAQAIMQLAQISGMSVEAALKMAAGMAPMPMPMAPPPPPFQPQQPSEAAAEDGASTLGKRRRVPTMKAREEMASHATDDEFDQYSGKKPGAGKAPAPPSLLQNGILPPGISFDLYGSVMSLPSLPQLPPLPPGIATAASTAAAGSGNAAGGMDSNDSGRPQRRRKPPSHMLSDKFFVSDVPTPWGLPPLGATATNSGSLSAPPAPATQADSAGSGKPAGLVKRRSVNEPGTGAGQVVAPLPPSLAAAQGWPGGATQAATWVGGTRPASASGPVLVAPQAAVRGPATTRMHQHQSGTAAAGATGVNPVLPPTTTTPHHVIGLNLAGSGSSPPIIPPLQSTVAAGGAGGIAVTQASRSADGDGAGATAASGRAGTPGPSTCSASPAHGAPTDGAVANGTINTAPAGPTMPSAPSPGPMMSLHGKSPSFIPVPSPTPPPPGVNAINAPASPQLADGNGDGLVTHPDPSQQQPGVFDTEAMMVLPPITPPVGNAAGGHGQAIGLKMDLGGPRAGSPAVPLLASHGSHGLNWGLPLPSNGLSGSTGPVEDEEIMEEDNGGTDVMDFFA